MDQDGGRPPEPESHGVLECHHLDQPALSADLSQRQGLPDAFVGLPPVGADPSSSTSTPRTLHAPPGLPLEQARPALTGLGPARHFSGGRVRIDVLTTTPVGCGSGCAEPFSGCHEDEQGEDDGPASDSGEAVEADAASGGFVIAGIGSGPRQGGEGPLRRP
jgi:hypothetical protein